MFSRFWARYRASGLGREFLERGVFITKAAAAIYIIRENVVEFTVVSGRGRDCQLAAQGPPRRGV